MSQNYEPYTDRLVEKLAASFGPAATSSKNIWRLKPGPVLENILRQRDDAIASLTELQDIADRNGITLLSSYNARQYFLQIDRNATPPAGWENVVKYSGAPRSLTPVDETQCKHIEVLLRKAQWVPIRDIEDDARRQVIAMYSKPENHETAYEASEVVRELSVEIAGDEVYILTPSLPDFGFDNWEKCSEADYYFALAKAQSRPVQSSRSEQTMRQG